MKRLFLLIVLLAISLSTIAQRDSRSKKLSSAQASKKTSDQRLIYETDRKSKKGKKDVSVKKKVRIEEKQNHRVRKMKDPKRRRPK